MRGRERERWVVRYELAQRLLELRGGDVEAMVDRLADGIVDGDLVALHDHGQQALVYDQLRGSILEGWLKEHRDELEWIHHELR